MVKIRERRRNPNLHWLFVIKSKRYRKRRLRNMVYILNTNLNEKRLLRKELLMFFGINRDLAHQICDQLGVSPQIRINQLSSSRIDELTSLISENYLIGSQLRRVALENRKRLGTISSYRGFRQNEGLPCRGQRTHGNGRTSRRNRVLLGNK